MFAGTRQRWPAFAYYIKTANKIKITTRMEYAFRNIEKKWQQHWKDTNAYKVNNPQEGVPAKPKCYVLDMFPYPSGAGLHVGHPLGYIASDIFARYKRLKGFNVLHPMGYDSFGLPAEQYALETGQHPAVTTADNISTFRKQLDNIGFCFDWSREVRTSDPKYYKWTQWIFLRLYNSYFCNTEQKALPIEKLIHKYSTRGALPKNGEPVPGVHFTAQEWNAFSEKERQEILMRRRLAYQAWGEVNWCEALGTVLANDEVINGVSERGGHPVIKKKMRQWYLRITAYAERLLLGLETVGFPEAMKDMQRNWIGRSEGAEVVFGLTQDARPTSNPSPRGEGEARDKVRGLRVYTTRPDTIFGVDFMVLAPEHELVQMITTAEQKEAVEQYLAYVKSRSERERLAEVKQITGVFTGSYAINPLNGRHIPVWLSEYVLAGYGTGAIMGVPCGDQRDFNFAKHFNIPITNIIGEHYNGEEANPTMDAILYNSGFIDGLLMKEAIPVLIDKLEELGIGKRKINYKMRDAGFSRQRYWGEPFPIIYKNGIACPVDEKELPVELPYVEKYSPGPEGEGPLANIPEWVNLGDGIKRETNTMPGYAGSSWYFLRYADPHNDEEFAEKKATDYWNQVDVYIGGTEHAVGHLLYSRMWTKVLFDLGLISFDEPYRKLVNQGMIQGSSRFVYRLQESGKFISKSILEKEHSGKAFQALHVDVNMVDGIELDIERFKKWKPEFASAEFILEADGKYLCGVETEKMSKSKYNTVNPDDLIEKYGADTFRMYEMFLGPVEQSKPWDTKGIEGVHRFLRKLWRLFFDEQKGKVWNKDTADPAELKILHRTIKKIQEDTERFSFNTAVSAFMMCVNELGEAGCHKKEVLEKLLIILTPYAPHISAELWQQLGNSESILDAPFPDWDQQYLVESSKEYPVSVNGKMRTTIRIALDASQEEVERLVKENEVMKKWIADQPLKKLIYVKGKMINVVI